MKEHFPSESREEARTQEAVRKILQGKLGRSARRSGELIGISPTVLPKLLKEDAVQRGPVTFDGFDDVGELRENLADVIRTLSASVRISRVAETRSVNGKEIVAEYREQPVGHVRVTVRPAGYREDMTTPAEVLSLLRRELFFGSELLKKGVAFEEFCLVDAVRTKSREEWMKQAYISLRTRPDLSNKEAMEKLTLIIRTILAGEKSL
ncbi:MAG: hypothetical protein WCK01_01945 [Candidatus Uhrbacteria bacterium]